MFTNCIKLASKAFKYAKAECLEAIERLKKPIEDKSEPLIFEWATVELLGHREIEGQVYQIGEGSTKLYRVVTAEGTVIVSPRSLYAITERTAPAERRGAREPQSSEGDDDQENAVDEMSF